MKTIKIIAFVAAAVLAGSCAKSINVMDKSDASRQSIGFSAFTHVTKASAIVGETGARSESFKMEAFDMSDIVEGAGVTATDYFSNVFGYNINSAFPSAWNTQTTQYWPVTAVEENTAMATTSLSFFSYGPNPTGSEFSISFDKNNYDGAVNRTLPKLSVSVAAANADQKDILAAMTEFKHWANGNKVNINYNHILSAITFSAKTESDEFKFVVDEIVVGVANNDISTGSLYPAGVYGFERNNIKGSWSGHNGIKAFYEVTLGSAVDITEANTEAVSTSLPLNANTGILMLIPQQLDVLDNEAFFCVKYKSYRKTGEDSYETTPKTYTKFAPLYITGMTEWKAGKKYNYVLNLADLDKKAIEYDVTVSDWEDWYETSPDIDIDFQNDVNSEELPVFETGEDGEFETAW